jgi:hypothetical protein
MIKRISSKTSKKNESRVNHTFALSKNVTMLVQTGLNHPLRIASPPMWFIGNDVAVSKNYDGTFKTQPEIHKIIMDACLPHLSDDDKASVLRPGLEGTQLASVYSLMTQMCLSIAKNDLGAPLVKQAVINDLNSHMNMSLLANDDVWPSWWPAKFAVHKASKDFGVDIDVNTAVAIAEEWASGLTLAQRSMVKLPLTTPDADTLASRLII